MTLLFTARMYDKAIGPRVMPSRNSKPSSVYGEQGFLPSHQRGTKSCYQTRAVLIKSTCGASICPQGEGRPGNESGE